MQIYNCNLLDGVVSGSLGYTYGYSAGDSINDNNGNSSSSTDTPSNTPLNPNDLYKDSSAVACAAGTRDVGIYDGYTNGSLVKIRLCAVSEVPSTGAESNGGFGISGGNGDALVNSRVSASWLALVKAGAKDGVRFRAGSTFRTMANQQALWVQFGMDENRVAKPGFSNHQMGLAIDFSDIYDSAGGSAGSCNPKQTANSNTYKWLEANAGDYGIKQYCAEAWHWSPSGN